MDIQLLYFLQDIRNDFLSSILGFITRTGDMGLIWILSSLVLLAFKRTRVLALYLLVGLLLMQITGNMLIKPLVNRLRPFVVYQDLYLIIPRPSGSSFPSGHTYSSFVFCFIFLWQEKIKNYGQEFFTTPKLKKYLKILVVFWAILVSFGRLYFAVHYPSDVLAGILLAFFNSIFVIKILNILSAKLMKNPINKL